MKKEFRIWKRDTNLDENRFHLENRPRFLHNTHLNARRQPIKTYAEISILSGSKKLGKIWQNTKWPNAYNISPLLYNVERMPKPSISLQYTVPIVYRHGRTSKAIAHFLSLNRGQWAIDIASILWSAHALHSTSIDIDFSFFTRFHSRSWVKRTDSSYSNLVRLLLSLDSRKDENVDSSQRAKRVICQCPFYANTARQTQV